MADQTSDKLHGQKLVPIEWPDSSGAAQYANHLLAQRDGNSMYLSFCQVNPPHLIGAAEEIEEQLERIKSLQAVLVARLVIPLDSFRAMFEVLQRQMTIMEEGENRADARATAQP
jgi:2-methylisocitrate lyase-like PEP mutase family enzyme